MAGTPLYAYLSLYRSALIHFTFKAWSIEAADYCNAAHFQAIKSILFFLQHGLQVSEGVMRRHCLHFRFSATHHLIQNARVFVIVAV